ncbi:hypothetical protein [Glycomyces buryatensis]|uniref:Uncharacterized protein n=1 Tax=Glycomyces buryatensis TaxID=2570927 RepID=A0A4S8QI94_9ACTN|nr:hypothetical protein [Glycomyces buryatensis]THV42982.1 hypothetical protein FAB82_03240 [Glycomyces buryatensis]
MSDSQFESESYGGLDSAAPSAAAPAFGDVTTQPGEVPQTGDDPIVCLPVERMGCSNAECGNPVEHPSETPWQELLSAVPVEDQLYRLKPRASDMSYPTEEDFRAAVAAVRPEHADEHSVARLRTGWNDEVAEKLGPWSDRLRSQLTDLSEGWAGTDFEAFQEVCDQTRVLVDDVIEDIDATVAGLQSTEEYIFSLQGGDSGEVPYPAPQFWIDGEWHSWVAVHVRPAWWHGDCIEYTCQDAEHVMALAGAAPEVATEIIEYIDDRVEHYIQYYESPVNIERDGLDPKGITLDVAKELAVADAMENFGGIVEQNWSEYDSRHSGIDEDIAQRSADNDAEQQSMRTTQSDKPYPDSADEAYMDLESPSMEQPTGRSSPETTQNPSLDPPSGDVQDDSSRESDDSGAGSVGDGGSEDGAGGGLASGGSGTGMGSGPGGGASVAAPDAKSGPTGGPGGGSFPPVSSAAATGAGAAAGTGNRGASGMMGGGGRGAGNGPSDNAERDPDVDLIEDENIWGYVNEDEDPYA